MQKIYADVLFWTWQLWKLRVNFKQRTNILLSKLIKRIFMHLCIFFLLMFFIKMLSLLTSTWKFLVGILLFCVGAQIQNSTDENKFCSLEAGQMHTSKICLCLSAQRFKGRQRNTGFQADKMKKKKKRKWPPVLGRESYWDLRELFFIWPPAKNSWLLLM